MRSSDSMDNLMGNFNFNGKRGTSTKEQNGLLLKGEVETLRGELKIINEHINKEAYLREIVK